MHDQALAPKRMKAADYVSQRWTVVVPEGVTRNKILEPSFWAHVCAKFEEGAQHIVEITDDPESFWMMVRVREKGKSSAVVQELLYVKLDAADSGAEDYHIDGFEVKWKGPHHKFCVIRERDSEIVQQGISKKTDAWKWITDNAAKVA